MQHWLKKNNTKSSNACRGCVAVKAFPKTTSDIRARGVSQAHQRNKEIACEILKTFCHV